MPEYHLSLATLSSPSDPSNWLHEEQRILSMHVKTHDADRQTLSHIQFPNSLFPCGVCITMLKKVTASNLIMSFNFWACFSSGVRSVDFEAESCSIVSILPVKAGVSVSRESFHSCFTRSSTKPQNIIPEALDTICTIFSLATGFAGTKSFRIMCSLRASHWFLSWDASCSWEFIRPWLRISVSLMVMCDCRQWSEMYCDECQSQYSLQINQWWEIVVGIHETWPESSFQCQSLLSSPRRRILPQWTNLLRLHCVSVPWRNNWKWVMGRKFFLRVVESEDVRCLGSHAFRVLCRTWCHG